MTRPICPTHRRPMQVEDRFVDAELVGISSTRHTERDLYVTTWACPLWAECRETDETVERRQW